jgi:hypothetical protein
MEKYTIEMEKYIWKRNTMENCITQIRKIKYCNVLHDIVYKNIV